MKGYGSLRWILLAVGVIAILGLTGMNVYSLYTLHEHTIESEHENKKLQIAEFTDRIRYRFYETLQGLGTVDINDVEKEFNSTGNFTTEVTDLLNKAAKDSIYNGIYFIPAESNVCEGQEQVLQYDATSTSFQFTNHYPAAVCDGRGIARTQMKSLITGYQYNNKIIFDSHRSITVALVNQPEGSIFGYLTMPLDQDYLRNTYLQEKLIKNFGNSKESGMKVWLRDWTQNEIIASSDPASIYNRENIHFEQNFPDFFDYWKIEVLFTDENILEASNNSLISSLIFLGSAVMLLLGALLFMFISAQKEQALAKRQAGFLANVTHELKTPLSVMQAAGENLADGRVKTPKRLSNYGTHIYNQSLRLRRMINKLLDVAKADAGKSLIEPEPVDPAKLVRTYLNDHRKYILDRNFTIDLEIEDPIPMIMVDPSNFDTILSNLVENAIKYSTDEKYLGLKLTTTSKKVLLKVEDKGVGISKKDQAYIFDKFYRVEDTMTAETKGHGLGLSIVKNLVELNGGTIKVDSKPSKGSVFTVSFPIFIDAADDSGFTTNINGHQKEKATSDKNKKTNYVS